MDLKKVEILLNEILDTNRCFENCNVTIPDLVMKLKNELGIPFEDKSIVKRIKKDGYDFNEVAIESINKDGNEPFMVCTYQDGECQYNSLGDDGETFDTIKEAEKFIENL